MSNVSAPAEGMWVEDPNSPFEFSGATEVSGALGDTGNNEYLIKFKEVTGESGTDNWVLTINGRTDSYAYVTDGGTQTTAASQWQLTGGLTGARSQSGEFRFQAHGEEVVGMGGLLGPILDGTPLAHYITNTGETDITSFTLDHPQSTSFSGTVEVYSR